MKGAVNVDRKAISGVDVAADAKALPFESKSFSEAHAINPHGFNPVNPETARVMQPGSRLYVTGTERNSFAKPMGAAEAEAAGFKLIESGPMIGQHNFGTQRATTGGALSTKSSTTTVYEVIKK
jgi:hypothetical protein